MRFLIILNLLVFGLSIQNYAQSSLSVYPKRAVFDSSKKKSQVFTLTNTGNAILKYEMSFINFKMNSMGAFEKLEKPVEGLYFASDYLRFYPRSVLLGPKESQVVKVQFRRKSDMKDAEYRSHLYIKSVPLISPNNDSEPNGNSPSSGIAIKLVPAFGYSLPIIIRVGNHPPEAEISDLKYQRKNDSISVVELQLQRKGLMSVYGNFEVNYINNSNKKTLLGKLQGVAVYAPLDKRYCRILLNHKEKNIDLSKGKLVVTFTSKQGKSRDLLLAEKIYTK